MRTSCVLCAAGAVQGKGIGGGTKGPTHQSLWFLDVFMSEKELAVKITQVDGVKVDNMDFAEACQDEVFEELASNAAGANQQHARLVKEKWRQYLIAFNHFDFTPSRSFHCPKIPYLLNSAREVNTERTLDRAFRHHGRRVEYEVLSG